MVLNVTMDSSPSLPVAVDAVEESVVVRQDGTRHLGCDESSGWIWQAARALNDYLLLQQADPPIDRCSILELGSGTGWLALQLASRGAQVTATDRPGALPLLIRNIVSNQERFCAVKKELNIDCQCLQWGVEEAQDDTMIVPGKWDLIVGSDILYLSEGYEALLRMIARHDFVQCVIAYEERKPQEEALFLQLAQTHGFDVEIYSSGTNPVSLNPIWILRMVYKKS